MSYGSVRAECRGVDNIIGNFNNFGRQYCRCWLSTVDTTAVDINCMAIVAILNEVHDKWLKIACKVLMACSQFQVMAAHKRLQLWYGFKHAFVGPVHLQRLIIRTTGLLALSWGLQRPHRRRFCNEPPRSSCSKGHRCWSKECCTPATYFSDTLPTMGDCAVFRLRHSRPTLPKLRRRGAWQLGGLTWQQDDISLKNMSALSFLVSWVRPSELGTMIVHGNIIGQQSIETYILPLRDAALQALGFSVCS